MAEELRIILKNEEGGKQGDGNKGNDDFDKKRVEIEKKNKDFDDVGKKAKQEAAESARVLNINIMTVGRSLIALASNNNAGAIGALLSQLGPLGLAFNVATGVVNAFNERGKELSKYSGVLGAAEQRAELRSMLDDIKEANQLGPDLANLVSATSDAQHELRDILLPVKKIVVENLAEFMSDLADFLHEWRQEITGSLIAFTQLIKALLQAVTFNGEGAINTLKDLPEKIRGTFGEGAVTDIDVFDNLIRDLRNVGRQAPQFNPKPIVNPNIPMFQGN